MKLDRLFIATLIVPLLGSAAISQPVSSIFSDTRSCRTIEEGPDRFTLRCPAPSGPTSAVLSYWDGHAFAAYDPFFSKSKKADIRDVAPSASRVFGQKLEWRMRAGVPCAAIIRIHTTRSGVLAVGDLSNGRHLGDAVANTRARELADAACLAGEGSVLATRPEGAAALSPAHSAPSASFELIGAVANRGQQAFQKTYEQRGIVGAIEEIKACYRDLDRQRTRAGLAYCAALDIAANHADSMMAQKYPHLAQGYFDRGHATEKRIDLELQKLGFGQNERTAFDRELAAALGLDLPEAQSAGAENGAGVTKPTPASKPKSVFDID